MATATNSSAQQINSNEQLIFSSIDTSGTQFTPHYTNNLIDGIVTPVNGLYQVDYDINNIASPTNAAVAVSLKKAFGTKIILSSNENNNEITNNGQFIANKGTIVGLQNKSNNTMSIGSTNSIVPTFINSYSSAFGTNYNFILPIQGYDSSQDPNYPNSQYLYFAIIQIAANQNISVNPLISMEINDRLTPNYNINLLYQSEGYVINQNNGSYVYNAIYGIYSDAPFNMMGDAVIIDPQVNLMPLNTSYIAYGQTLLFTLPKTMPFTSTTPSQTATSYDTDSSGGVALTPNNTLGYFYVGTGSMTFPVIGDDYNNYPTFVQNYNFNITENDSLNIIDVGFADSVTYTLPYNGTNPYSLNGIALYGGISEGSNPTITTSPNLGSSFGIYDWTTEVNGETIVSQTSASMSMVLFTIQQGLNAELSLTLLKEIPYDDDKQIIEFILTGHIKLNN